MKSVIASLLMLSSMSANAACLGETTVNSKVIRTKIWKAPVYERKMSWKKLLYGAFEGILLFAIVINIFLFLAFRKTYYLLYSLLVFLYILSAAAVLEGFIIYLLPGTDMMQWYMLVPVLDMPALLLYCISFLELNKYTPALRKVMIVAVIFTSAHFILLHFLPLMTGILLNYIYAALVFLLAIIAGIKAAQKGNSIGKYFAWAYTVWLLLLVAELSFILTGWPGHIFDISYVSVAIFIETFLLALRMVRKFLWEKRDDEKAKMQIKEQTLENKSQEIQDNSGQTLTRAKLKLATVSGNNPETESR